MLFCFCLIFKKLISHSQLQMMITFPSIFKWGGGCKPHHPFPLRTKNMRMVMKCKCMQISSRKGEELRGKQRRGFSGGSLQIHWLFTYIYIFPEYICLKKSAGMSDLKLKDIKKSCIIRLNPLRKLLIYNLHTICLLLPPLSPPLTFVTVYLSHSFTTMHFLSDIFKYKYINEISVIFRGVNNKPNQFIARLKIEV